MMDWISLGWRDGILILVAVAAIYLVFMLLRLIRVGRQRQAAYPMRHTPEAPERFDIVSPLRQRQEAEPEVVPEPAPQAVASRSALAAYAEAMEDAAPMASFAVRPAPTFEWDDVKELFGDEPASSPPVPPSAPRSGGFGEPLAAHLARTDVEEEIQRMRDEMERMRREMDDLRTMRRVSPQYAEAMELAQRGLTAQDVADQLGISLGEAELVHALSRSRQNSEEGETNGAEGNAADDGFHGLRHRNAG
jgi:hypothetical protein